MTDRFIRASVRMHVRMQSTTADDRGEIRASTAVGALILLVAFLAFKQEFFHFFHWLMNQLFSSLHSSFGTGHDHAAHHAATHAGPSGGADAAGNAKSAIGPAKAAKGAE